MLAVHFSQKLLFIFLGYLGFDLLEHRIFGLIVVDILIFLRVLKLFNWHFSALYFSRAKVGMGLGI